MARIPRFSDRIATTGETVKLAVVKRCRQIHAIRIAEDQLVVERVSGFGSLQGIGSPGGVVRRRDGSDPFLDESIERDPFLGETMACDPFLGETMACDPFLQFLGGLGFLISFYE